MIDGLEAYDSVQPSNIGWIGELPTHWTTRRLKYVTRDIVGGATPASNVSEYWDGGEIVWVTPVDVSQNSLLRTSARKITQEGLDSCSAKLVPPGSIIITSRAPVGNVALADVDLCTNQGCKAIVPRSEVMLNVFLFYVLATMTAELRSLATGTTFQEISSTRLSVIRVPCPPLDEQRSIVRFLRHAQNLMARYVRLSQHLVRPIGIGKQYVGLLREYEARLIADVVTGKFDVRRAAAGLPDELEIELADDEILDELENLADECPEGEVEEEVA